MPYHVGWIDEERRILKVQPVDPLSDDELEALLLEAQDLLDQRGPLYILADLRHFSWKKAPSLSDRSVAFPQEPRSDIALALLGGGFLLKVTSRIISNRFLSRPYPVRMRVFKYEDRAYTWLSALADGLPG